LPYAGPEGSTFAAEVWEHQRHDIERRIEELHAEFERLTVHRVGVEWCGRLGDPTRSLAEAARLADLIVTATRRGAATGDAYRNVNAGTLVLQAGRPVLIAAYGASSLTTKNVLVAWKDTRESRRAIVDAIPLLSCADDVTVVTVARDPDEETRTSIADVAAFLLRHGINARTEVISAKEETERFAEYITMSNPDLVVSGAYGHSRLREWAFGGVTRSLLDQPGLNRFMAS